MKKLVVLLLIVTGFAFLGEPTARAGVGFVFGLPIPVPVFWGPGYYGPGPFYGAPYYGYGGYYGYGPYWRNRYYSGYYGRGYYRGGYYGGRYYRGGYYGGRTYNNNNWHHWFLPDLRKIKYPKKTEGFSWVVSRTRANVLQWRSQMEAIGSGILFRMPPLFVSLRD
jgi:hypothetical protein